MEDTMCWEIDYKFFAEQKKAQQTRIEQERRAGVIHQLLNEANKQGEPSNVEGTPAKEPALGKRERGATAEAAYITNFPKTSPAKGGAWGLRCRDGYSLASHSRNSCTLRRFERHITSKASPTTGTAPTNPSSAILASMRIMTSEGAPSWRASCTM